MGEKIDVKTSNIIREGKQLKDLTNHEGYAIAKAKLISRLQGIIDIHTLDMDTTPEQLAIELKARQKASQMVLEWLRVDIEGTVQQTETNTSAFTLNTESLIIREE